MERVGIGSTVADLHGAYGDDLSIEQVHEDDPAGVFGFGSTGLDDGINGVTNRTDDDGVVLEMWAGEGCPRTYE